MNPRIQRFVVGSGDADKFDVLEGCRLNDKPLARTEAYRLARSRALSAAAAAAAVPAPKPKPVLPQACSGEESKRRMEAANAKPFDLGLLASDPWNSRGGSSGFSWNGSLVSGRKP
jgi:hypothetical protein